jgi:hypothetical protein
VNEHRYFKKKKIAAGVAKQDIMDAKFVDDNLESCDLRCVSCINLKMELSSHLN